ncbi:lytic transglycosylase domain-containing protein [Hydrogenophaga sp. NFH-34]|uniref:lytic transglycosylase domain-containing protein n=1 Tax=Hydrogenophaga sp. NFH-34 TaxID=2744446 RepID=UPI001F483F50|nr:lytic transglycosylase domain-containing protein [Hydrogenophaga sp. NFH-34]
MPDATVQRATTTDRAAAVAEQLLQRPLPAVRSHARARQMTPEMAQMLQRASRHFAVDAHLVQAVIHAESAFNPRAVSPKNAIGLMQVLPSTARDLGLQELQGLSVEQLLADPRVSIVLGTKYLAEQLARFDGNVELAVAAYNAGPGAVIKAGHRVPNYPETRQYVRRVLSLAKAYQSAVQGTAEPGEPT